MNIQSLTYSAPFSDFRAKPYSTSRMVFSATFALVLTSFASQAGADPMPPAAGAPPATAVHQTAPPRSATACEPCEDDDGVKAQGFGGFFLGALLLPLSSLNDRLEDNGYDKVPSVLTLIGGEGHAVFDSGFVAGARGGAILSPQGDGPGEFETRFNGGFGMLDFGFAFVQTQPVLVTLTGGLGGYGLNLAISDNQDVDFDEALANPRQSVSLGRGGLLVGATLGVDGRVSIGTVRHGRRRFLTLGARVGALYGPTFGQWGLSDGSDADGGPSIGLTGGFAALVIGFGGDRAP
jgi:hypothetical protein